MRSTLWIVGFGLLLCALAGGVSGCGGGGADGGAGGTVLTSLLAVEYLSHVESQLRLVGEELYPVGGEALVRVRATSGTPFQGGTSAMLELPASVDSAQLVSAFFPPTRVNTDTTAELDVVFSDGVVATAPGTISIVAQRVESILPVTIDGSRSVPFTVMGVGLAPVGGSVEVTFSAGAASFHAGASAGSDLRTTGFITSSTTVEGVVPYAGVLAPTPASVSVTLATGDRLRTAGTPATFMPGNAGIRGTWSYERVPITDSGLDYGSVTSHPIRRARVQLIDAGSGAVITSRTTDAMGAFEIDYSEIRSVFVRVLAETTSEEIPVLVKDNTAGGAVWAADAPALSVQGMWNTPDYVAGLGWDGAAYDADRASGPFALMDTAYEAAETIRAARPTFTFAPCRINWSVDNVPTDGNASIGEIGGPHYDGELWFLGKDGIETDEFDVPLIVHEWGHYLTDTLGRDDSPGGSHSYGEFKQPTLAFSEGFATALSAMINDPEFIYRDSFGPGQGSLFARFDLQDNAVDTPNPGWFSEQSILYLVTDLYDSDGGEAWDSVSLGLGPLIDALAGAVKSSDSLTTIFSFIHALKLANPGASAAIDALCAHHAFGTVVDEWGTGETNAGDVASNLPVFFPGTVGLNNEPFTMYGDHLASNDLRGSRFLRVPGNGGTITVRATTSQPAGANDDHDVAVIVMHEGERVVTADDFFWGTEVAAFASQVGETYVVELFSWSLLPGSYTCTVSIQ